MYLLTFPDPLFPTFPLSKGVSYQIANHAVVYITLFCCTYRHVQRLERRNSIRQSLHSVRSIGSINGGFPENTYRRKMAQMVFYELSIPLELAECYLNFRSKGRGFETSTSNNFYIRQFIIFLNTYSK